MGKSLKPADPEAEKAELRQLTRELHEAAQDARAAARELREARKIVEKTVDDTLGSILEQLGKDIENGMKKMNKTFESRTDDQVNQVGQVAIMCVDKIKEIVAEAECRIAGYSNRQDLADQIVSEIHNSIPELARDKEFIDDVADAVSSQMKFVPMPAAAMSARAGVAAKIVSQANHS